MEKFFSKPLYHSGGTETEYLTISPPNTGKLLHHLKRVDILPQLFVKYIYVGMVTASPVET